MSKEFNKDVGLNLKQIRKENKVSADTIAEYLGITESSYYYIESGKTELKVSRLKLISECLDVPMAVILGESIDVIQKIEGLRREMKINYLPNTKGIQVGDKIRFFCQGKTKKMVSITGTCKKIELNHPESPHFPKFHIRKEGKDDSYFGDNVILVSKGKRNLIK